MHLFLLLIRKAHRAAMFVTRWRQPWVKDESPFRSSTARAKHFLRP